MPGTRTVALPGPAEVVEGVVVDDAPVPAPVPLRVVQVVKIAAQHEHTKMAGRHLAYIPLGAAVLVKRLWDSRTTSRYERFMRAAEASGNHEAALEWDDRMQRFRKDRHERRVAMIEVARARAAGRAEDRARAVPRAGRDRDLPRHRREAHLGDRRAVRGRRAHRRVGRNRGVRVIWPGPACPAVDRPGGRCGGPAAVTPTPT